MSDRIKLPAFRRRSSQWRFLIMCRDEYNDNDYSRLFVTADKARQYITNLHRRLWDKKVNDFKPGFCFESAQLYRIKSTGRLTLIDEYDVLEDRSGAAVGWLSEDKSNDTTRNDTR